MKRLRQLPTTVLFGCLPAILAGCAPSFYDLPKTYNPVMVERTVMVKQGVLEPVMRREVIVAAQSDGTPQLTRLGPVRWFPASGPERAQAPLKQVVATPLSIVPDTQETSGLAPNSSRAVLPKVGETTIFYLDKEWQLTPDANALVASFRAPSNLVYEVQFLYQGPVDPVAAYETTTTWNALVQRLVSLGAIGAEQIRLASAHYNQPQNGIALVATREGVEDE